MKLNNVSPNDLADLLAIVAQCFDPDVADSNSMFRFRLMYCMNQPGILPNSRANIYRQADIAADWLHEHGFQLYENILRLFSRFRKLGNNWRWWWVDTTGDRDCLFVAQPQVFRYTVEWLTDYTRNAIVESSGTWLYTHCLETGYAGYRFAARLDLDPSGDRVWEHASTSSNSLVNGQTDYLLEQLTRFTAGLLKSKANITKSKPTPIGFKLRTAWRPGN